MRLRRRLGASEPRSRLRAVDPGKRAARRFDRGHRWMLVERGVGRRRSASIRSRGASLVRDPGPLEEPDLYRVRWRVARRLVCDVIASGDERRGARRDAIVRQRVSSHHGFTWHLRRVFSRVSYISREDCRAPRAGAPEKTDLGGLRARLVFSAFSARQRPQSRVCSGKKQPADRTSSRSAAELQSDYDIGT